MSIILRIGHRGACGYAPENTLRSFQKALDLGVDMIELDVRLCRSGEVLVIHDARLNRTTDGGGWVRRKNLAAIKRLNAGEGETVPALEEVLDLVDRKAKVNIDLKGGNTLWPVVHLIERYVRNKNWHYDDFLVSSGNRRLMMSLAQSHSSIPLGLVVGYRSLGSIRLATKLRCRSIHLNKRLVKLPLLAKSHAHGLKVFVWTVNEPEDIERMKELKVDGIFSDYPDRI